MRSIRKSVFITYSGTIFYNCVWTSFKLYKFQQILPTWLFEGVRVIGGHFSSLIIFLVLVEMSSWSSQQRNLEEALEESVIPENLVDHLLKSEENWRQEIYKRRPEDKSKNRFKLE